MIKRLKKWLGIHEHDRKLFLIGDIALVKCRTCGAESIPWNPPVEAVARAQALGHHENDAREIAEINARIRGQRG